MLQPMQPMGVPNQAATGPQGAKPQQPQQPQQAPAGALIGMMPSGGIMAPIDKVANAYKGNPQALEQKANISNDLLAALAKQRLDAKLAHEQQQLQLARGAQQGQNQKSVIEQLDDRLLERQTDITKQEMTQEQADTLKQKQGQMQEAQKRLMQQAMAQPQQPGIAGLPAPNAAEPKAMAAGGIIAFDGGGTTTIDPVTGEPYTEERRTGLGDWFSAQSAKARGFSPEAAEAIKVNPDVQAYVDKYGQQLLSSPDLPAFQRDPRGYVQQKQAEAARPVNQAQAQAVPTATAQLEGGPQPGAKDTPKPNAADIRRPTPIQNIGGIPGGGGIGSTLNKAINTQLEQDPQKVAEATRASSYEFMKPDEKDVAARREQLSGIQALNKKYFDPDQQQIRELTRTLAVGPTSFAASTMGNLGRNAARSSEDEYRQQRAALLGEEKGLASLMGDIYAPKKEAVTAGTAAATGAAHTLGSAMTTAGHIKSAEINAAVSAANNAAMAAERALTRETNDQRYWGQTYKDSLSGMETAIAKIDKIYADQVKAMPVMDKPNAEQQKRLLELDRDRKAGILEIQKTYAPLIQQAADKAGISKLGAANIKSAGGFTLESVTK